MFKPSLTAIMTMACMLLLAGLWLHPAQAVVPEMPKPSAPSLNVNPDFGKMSLYFIPNQGQMDEQVDFMIQGKDKSVYFTSEGLTFVLTEQRQGPSGREKAFLRDMEPGQNEQQPDLKRWVVKLDFVGAREDVRPQSLEQAETVVSYFKGRPEDWKTGLQTSSKIIYRDLWPGIDLIYYGTVNRLKYDFIVHPGANPNQIKLAYRGVDDLSVTPEGRLEMSTPLGSFQDDIPVAWQDGDSGRMDVPVAYALLESSVQLAGLDGITSDSQALPGINTHHQGHVYGFTVGAYDPGMTLVLDPAILVYCGYIGGAGTDFGYGIAVDGSGNAYVTGYTDSTQTTFPVTAGPDLSHNGGNDAFVAKVNADGTALIYSGFIGGSGIDYGEGIAVDGSGNAYVVGYTTSPDPASAMWTGETPLPAVVGPDLTHNGGYDAFVAKVNTDGTTLVYCGYIGGSTYDSGNAIAVDSEGYAYVAGITASGEGFPRIGGLDSTYNGGTYDAFVAKVMADGTGLVYSGYIGGDQDDRAYGIAVDQQGNAYVTGRTRSSETTFPVTVGPDLIHNGNDDAFVAKVAADGSALSYCGYIGGSSYEEGYGIVVDNQGHAYITGSTSSTEATFPVTVGPDLTQNGSSDAFVAKVAANGTSLIYAGFIGGSGQDSGQGIAVDDMGNVYIVGDTRSTEASFPVKAGPNSTFGGDQDAFVAKVNADGTALVYSGFIGGSGGEWGKGIAVNSSGHAFVVGITTSAADTFPVESGPDLIHNGGYDAFVAKIDYQPYSVVYHGNGHTDGVEPVDGEGYETGDTVTVSGNTGGLVKSGHDFNGWNTQTDGGGVDHAPGDTFLMPASDVDLYAKWTPDTYAVTYNANGATSGTAPEAQVKTHGVDLTLRTNTGNLAKTGHSFAGWNTQADGLGTDYAAGALYTANEAATLYAKWIAPSNHTITVSAIPSAGGTATGSDIYVHGSTATVNAAANSGYVFVHWTEGSTVVSCSAQYVFTVTGNRTLRANFSPVQSQYTIAGAARPSKFGTVIGSGSYNHGVTVTMTALPNQGFTLNIWIETWPGLTGYCVVSTDEQYSFTATRNRTLTATIRPKAQPGLLMLLLGE
jgi:uncharacterized repeat protein (TIGR02543 family)